MVGKTTLEHLANRGGNVNRNINRMAKSSYTIDMATGVATLLTEDDASSSGPSGGTNMNEIVPLSVVTAAAGLITVDSTSTTLDGVAAGTTGQHHYQFTRTRNGLDLSAASVPLTLLAGSNCTVTGGNSIEKSTTGTAWNSYGYSAETFDAADLDFAVEWDVEATTGTIREMGGLDDNPAGHLGYQSMEHAVYQVNSSFYATLYEKGVGIPTGVPSTALAIGDQIGVMVRDKVVTYYVRQGGSVNEIVDSTKTASAIYHFKGAMSRGTSSSGFSRMDGISVITGTVPDTTTVSVTGASQVLVSDKHRAELARLGITISSGATYDVLSFVDDATSRFTVAGTATPIAMKHGYINSTVQDVQTITV